MSLVTKYRYGNSQYPATNMQIDSLSTLESIKSRQGWILAAQVANIAAISHQTSVMQDSFRLVNNTLQEINSDINAGFSDLQESISRLESNLLENLNEIKWYLFNVDSKLEQIINLIKFSGATKSAEYNRQGFILYKIESYDDAIIQFEKSLQENPLNIEAYINLAFVYLRKENLEKAIFCLERASKLVKEDFSYSEQISADRIKSTEIFILENLASFYSLRNSYADSIVVYNKILSEEIAKDTEILAKYKLAKEYYRSGDFTAAIGIFEKLIESQYFKPVAIAVAGDEFSEIRLEILEIIEEKINKAKADFGNMSTEEKEEINSLEISEETRQLLQEKIELLHELIIKENRFELLLSSDFKENQKSFYNYLNTIAELEHHAKEEWSRADKSQNKIDKILEQLGNTKVGFAGDNVSKLSHNIFLSKLKEQIKKGLEEKSKEIRGSINTSDAVSDKIKTGIEELSSLRHDNILTKLETEFTPQKFVELISVSSINRNNIGSYREIVEHHGEFNDVKMPKSVEEMKEEMKRDLETSLIFAFSYDAYEGARTLSMEEEDKVLHKIARIIGTDHSILFEYFKDTSNNNQGMKKLCNLIVEETPENLKKITEILQDRLSRNPYPKD